MAYGLRRVRIGPRRRVVGSINLVSGDQNLCMLIVWHIGRCFLTPFIAVFTLSFLISPVLERLSINSALVEPEQYQAIDTSFLATLSSAGGALLSLWGM